MKSAWWWGTDAWEAYQMEYYKGRERPEEYKTSPLADDHDFPYTECAFCDFSKHDTQVIDVSMSLAALWTDVRPSYHSIIHRANENFAIDEMKAWDLYSIQPYVMCHTEANGRQPRPDATYFHQSQWLTTGNGLLVTATDGPRVVAAAYWIIYKDCAYYASGPSVEKNVQHAVIWESICKLHTMGIHLAELGQIDGATEKERNIGKFKQGFGGTTVTFTTATRRAA